MYYLIVSSPRAVRPTTLSFVFGVNTYVFNVKSYTECHKDQKGIKKATTGLILVSKTLAPCIMCVQYRGGAQYRGGVQYRGGYHEYHGGYLEYRGGVQYRGRIS